MSLFISSLNSGSNGNCYYVGNETEAILVDAGISCRDTEQRMKRLGLCMSKVRAVFVSHEHSDHIKGIPVLAKKYSLPVYITPATLKNSYFSLGNNRFHSFRAGEPILIGSLNVTPFIKAHDAAEPHSFIIEHKGVRVGVLTDIGTVCDNVSRYFSQCHAVFLESNYDEEMLATGKYPFFLKNRIRGGKGHLSNSEALALVQQYRASYLNHLILSHLSRENNCPELVHRLFSQGTEGISITVASRYKETPVFNVTGGAEVTEWREVSLDDHRPAQLALF